MIRETVRALLACVVSFVLCVVAYPAVVWGLGQIAFPRQAEGSLIYGRDRTVIGSELIAQPFASDGYFRPRPSAAGANGYDASAASGSNLATTNPALRTRIAVDAARYLVSRDGDAALKALLDRLDAQQAEVKAKGEARADAAEIAKLGEAVSATQAEILGALAKADKAHEPVPVDLVTASGAGLDPDISPEAARYQAPRVAAARGMAIERVRALIDAHTERSGALIGAPPRVNVLKLNLALDAEPASR
jgi:potassium-transporting ATPase KdpC subunit